MTHELLLTSVAQGSSARGFAPSVHGFYPVAMNTGISPRIREYLSAWNLYQHRILQSGGVSLPVVYSHLILPGEIEHVLTRITATETDHGPHPNLLVHHVVLEDQERTSEGPGWLLALPNFHLSEWNEPPLRFPCGRSIPTLVAPPTLTRRQQIAQQYRWLDPRKMSLTGFVDTESMIYRTAIQKNEEQRTLVALPATPCPKWKELTGDSGWGGILAETAFSGQPVVLIYEPEMNILPLYVEALALLPPHSSWLVTFCTYFTGLPDTISCQWKGVLANSEEAKQLAHDANNLVLDLTALMKEAPTGKYVEFARHGQEHMLPQDAEEYITVLANADTKTLFGESPKKELVKPDGSAIKVSEIPPAIRHPQSRTGLFGMLLHRSSRFQFYFLYSIMFALVLFLSLLAVDQIGHFGIVQKLQNWSPSAVPLPMDHLPLDNGETAIESDLNEPAQTELDLPTESEPATEEYPRADAQKIFEGDREKQKEPLRQFLESFAVPEFLAINFPDVQDDHVNVPVQKMFEELSPLYPFGTALELRFISIFELPNVHIKTRLMIDELPNLVWQVVAVDTETELVVPMFCFQLTDSGLTMDWQPEGLNNQYLYDTILSSLGFLELIITDMPESAKQIALFAPVKAEPMKISELANLSQSEESELVMELPFASELWQRIFAELNPPKNMILQVQPESTGNEMRIGKPESASEFHVTIRTSQQVGITGERGEIVFENIAIGFAAAASFENVVWKGQNKDFPRDRESIISAKDELEQKIKQLDTKVFEGNEPARRDRETYRAELRELNSSLKKIESLLEKFPAAYEELRQNESAQFHYSVFLESAKSQRKLLVLTTESTGE